MGSLIESHIRSLSGIDADDAAIGRVRFDYVAPDAVVVGNRSSDSPFVDGYDFKRLALGTTRAAVTKLISDAAFAATFFRRYWLILDASQNDANDVVASVEDLDLANIGVARFEAGNQDDLDLLRSPKGEPVPNRQNRSLKEALTELG